MIWVKLLVAVAMWTQRRIENYEKIFWLERELGPLWQWYGFFLMV
jgi:hypothetical protein